MKRCDIIIPVWNQPDITRQCIDSIVKNTRYPYRLIIIDNASGHVTEEYLKELQSQKSPEVILIRNEQNLGFVKAVNQGIERSTGPYVCIANNDIIVTEDWLGELIDIMDKDQAIGLINPSSSTSGENPGPGQSVEEYASSLKRFRGDAQELYTCRGFAMVVRRSVLKDVGLLDEIYHVGYFDDTDYCKRAQAKGYKTLRAKASYVYHIGNTSFKALDDNNELFKKNEKVFFSRWGRQVRVGYFVNRIDSSGRVDELVRAVVKSGHQISVFMKNGMPWPVTLDHYDIRRIDLSPFLFRLTSFYKILKRKKKKMIDVVLTDDSILGSMLNLARPIHGSVVLVNAASDEILKAVSKRSKIF